MKLPSLREPHAVHLWAGLTLWLLWFGLLYGGAALACRWWPLAVEALPLAVLSATAPVVTALAWAAWAQARGGHPRRRAQHADPARRAAFLVAVGSALYALAAVATLLVGATAAWWPACV